MEARDYLAVIPNIMIKHKSSRSKDKASKDLGIIIGTSNRATKGCLGCRKRKKYMFH